jgi:hypothetical protein
MSDTTQIKISTLSCRLFGHMFVGERYFLEDGEWMVEAIMTGFCVRCGIQRPPQPEPQ